MKLLKGRIRRYESMGSRMMREARGVPSFHESADLCPRYVRFFQRCRLDLAPTSSARRGLKRPVWRSSDATKLSCSIGSCRKAVLPLRPYLATIFGLVIGTSRIMPEDRCSKSSYRTSRAPRRTFH